MNAQQTIVSAPSIVCEGCASAIKTALGKLKGVAQIEVDTIQKTVTVKHDERVERRGIIAALDDAGFPAS